MGAMLCERPRRPGPVRLVIAESTPMVSQLLAAALRRERAFTVVGCASTVAELAALLASQSDMLLIAMDLEVPRGGLQITRRLLGENPALAIMMLIDDGSDAQTVVQA